MNASPQDPEATEAANPARLRRAAELDLSDPGQRLFGDFELLERLGVGGMGVVYRARQLSLDREVAVKLLDFDPFAAEDLLALFASEARHAGSLQHPNIVPVFSTGRHGSFHYFAMALVRGPSLRERMVEGLGRQPRELARLMRTIAEAVEYAHQVGLLHLDLKPGNVLVDGRGQPQVTDFGLAQRLEEAGAGNAVRVVAGTPAYMAPEQAVGDPALLGPATDVWGLGGILYALLTGHAPFEGADAEDTRQRVLRDELRAPRALVDGLSPDLDAICRHCLQKDPARRYPSARAMADDLQRFLDGRPVSVRPQGGPERLWRWTRREPASALLAGALLLSLVGGLALTTRLYLEADRSRAVAQSTLWDLRRGEQLAAALRDDPLAGLPGLIDNIAEAEAAGRTDDALQDRRRLAMLLAMTPRQIRGWQLDSEGRSVAFAEDGRLLLLGLRDGELLALELPDGRTRWQIQPEFPDTPWGASFVGRIEATADGRHALLFPSGSSGIARPDSSHMHRVRLVDGQVDTWPQREPAVLARSYSADGSRVLLRDAEDRLHIVDADTGQPLAAAIAAEGSRHCLLASVAPRLACASAGFRELRWIDTHSGRTLKRFDFGDGGELSAWWLDDHWLALGSSRGQLLLHAVDDSASHHFGDAASDALSDLRFDDGLLLVSSHAGTLRMLDLELMRWLGRPVSGGQPRIHSARLEAQSGWLLANDSRALLWRLGQGHDGRIADPLFGMTLRHRGLVVGLHGVALHGPQRLLASHGNDGELKLYRLPAELPQLDLAGVLPDLQLDISAPDRLRVSEGRLTIVDEQGHPVWTLADSLQPQRILADESGRRWLVAAADQLLLLDTRGGQRSLTLPASPQYLLMDPQGSTALVGWITGEAALNLHWRTLDPGTGEWLSPSVETSGLPDGVRLAQDGRSWAWWQGPRLFWHEARSGALRGELVLASDGEFVSDVAIGRDGRGLLVATRRASRLLPAGIEYWRVTGEGLRLARRIETPSAHTRVFELGDRWFGRGPVTAVYGPNGREELDQLAGRRGEAAAVSADHRHAALAIGESVQLFDLARMQALHAARRLPLAVDDRIVQLAFEADGQALWLQSHFGQRLRLDIGHDTRPIDDLLAEADDLAPARGRLAPLSMLAQRRLRDPGPPAAHQPRHPQAGPVVDTLAVDDSWRAQVIDLSAVVNVPHGLRFQGARNGLGITDSASWPRGRLRLRGVDFLLGDALQLAPEGKTLGAERFRQRSGAIALPAGPGGALVLLIANQHAAEVDGLLLHWLSATGEILASRTLDVPTTWDNRLHEPGRGFQPLADVGLIVRSAESSEGGGGSAQLLVYQIERPTPAEAATAAAIELDAPGATPLLLAVSRRR